MILLILFCLSALGDVVIPPVHATTINLEKTPPQPPPKPKYNGPIFLDTRPPFDYAMGHLPQAVSIRWQDYSQTEDPHKGGLDPDLDFLARKLSFLGINPSKQVIALGLGAKGSGEEGRIGWMLNYIGIKKVKLENILNVPGRKTLDNNFQYESSTPWNPSPVSYLRARMADVQDALGKPGFAVIDVREGGGFTKIIPGSIAISWKKFISEVGEPLPAEKVKSLLSGAGVDSGKTLIFYSEDGVTSAYATFVAYQAGLRAGNYDGGFQEWSATPQNPVASLQKDK